MATKEASIEELVNDIVEELNKIPREIRTEVIERGSDVFNRVEQNF